MATKRKAPAKVSDQVRAAIDHCGMSRYAISKLSGVGQPALSRFMSGERGLSMEALDAIGGVIKLKAGIPKQPR